MYGRKIHPTGWIVEGSVLIEKFTKEVRSKIKKQLDEQNDKITRFEVDKAMLQKQIKKHNRAKSKESGKRRRTRTIWQKALPSNGWSPHRRKKKKRRDVLQKVMSLCSDAEIDIPDMAYDRAHRISKPIKIK